MTTWQVFLFIAVLVGLFLVAGQPALDSLPLLAGLLFVLWLGYRIVLAIYRAGEPPTPPK